MGKRSEVGYERGWMMTVLSTCESQWSRTSISLLHALFLSNAGGGIFDGLYAFNNVFRIEGGGMSPAVKMSRLLPESLVSMSFEDMVYKIEDVQESAQVRVHSSKGITSGKYVVVTGVPSVTAKIVFEPPLSGNKRKSLEQLNGGSVIRMMAVYNEGPFWRWQNLSGSFGDLTDYTLAGLGYDMTPSDPQKDGYLPETGVPGVLQVETVGLQTALFMDMTPAERAKNLTSTLAALFGPRARNATEVLSFDFQGTATLGGGKSSYPPGMWTQVGKYLREPHGPRVHWAGTEYASYGFGYMEGALRSANQTAAMLLQLLQQ